MARRGEQLAATREHAPPRRAALARRMSFVTGVPGSASAGSRPTRRSTLAGSSCCRVARCELEVAAHVEMIEQRPRCGTRPSWPRSRSSCAATTSKPASSSSSRSNSTRAGVDLPAPEPPSSTTTSPAPIVRSMPSISTRPSKRDAQAADRQRFHAARTVADTVSPVVAKKNDGTEAAPLSESANRNAFDTRGVSGQGVNDDRHPHRGLSTS